MRIWLLGLTGLGLLLAGGCSDSSDGGGSSLATLRGTVTLHGDWPAEGEIQVSLFSTWHTEMAINIAPQGPPDFHTEGLFSPDSTLQVHQVAFEIPDVNPGSYPSLVVGWRNGGQLGVDEPVLGLYGANLADGDSLPAAVTLQAGQELELSFEGWLDRIAPAVELDPGLVAGTVEFADSWPTAYAHVYVVFMSSSDPAAPSNPGASMQEVSAASPDFEIQVGSPVTGHLAVYGFPYGADPWAAFYGGYGWDWDATPPGLTPLVLQEGESGLGGLVLTCRNVRD
ncbi:MAG: hypothetical protein WC326_05800 [Candidatus Delongbacteria bacterium]